MPGAPRGRDWTELEACFEKGVRFRALVPPGFRAAEGSASATEYFERWFGHADGLVLVKSDFEQIQDRLSINYRLRVHKDAWYIVEQQMYCDVIDERIQRMDLLCSGFLLSPSRDD